MVVFVFVLAWLALAVALPADKRHLVVVPLLVAVAFEIVGLPIGMYTAVGLSPFAGLAVAFIAGYTHARRANIAGLAVIAAVVVGIFAWGARDDMGVFDPDAALRAVLIVAVVYAIPWAIGHAASELRDPKAAA